MTGQDVVLVAMRPADAARCAELEEVLFPGEDPWSEQAFHSELAQPHNHYVTAHLGGPDGLLVGYAGIARLGRAGDPENEVHTIGVDPAHQRHGIGALLLTELLRVADAHGGETWLEVRTDNTAAQALYADRGFEVVGRRPRYYQPSGADAFTMRRPAATRTGDSERPAQEAQP
ncbi:ribosomal protein S18-alanine N-acetyltransferase [Rhodococcus sp. X156]|uniref:ribosomal protein S18-alanine N-acetyltransferase n=1 Tax=Rhodococcus sp. X156 TaxID=2499145 RepID=UPI000FDCADF7|nr:ribosomal protein S18-alanine N-acetyltransferase [Rhodococcus sp. X156]